MVPSREDILVHLRKQLCKLVVARSYIDAALKACELFLSHVRETSDDLYLPLVNAIIICYARPFTHNEPLGPLPDRWGRFEDPELQGAHRALLDLRDWIAAHGDMHMQRIVIVPPDAPVGPSGVRSGCMGLIVEYFHLRMEMFPKIRDACLDIGRRLDREVEQLLRTVLGDFGAPPGITVPNWLDVKGKEG